MAGVVKLPYTQDLKSCGRKSMRVGVPPPAPLKTARSVFYFCLEKKYKTAMMIMNKNHAEVAEPRTTANLCTGRAGIFTPHS